MRRMVFHPVSRRALSAAACALAALAPAWANTLLVPQQYATIQDAVDAALNGDEVVVDDGTWSGPGNVDVDLLGKAITVRSANGPTNCVIECQAAGRAFHLHSGETVVTTIQGFTIQDGDGGNDGGAILLDGASASILGCVFRGNTASFGGAIGVLGGFPSIVSCLFRGNSADIGGALSIYGGGGVVNSCHFEENVASSWGGAVSINWSSATSRYNTFVENSSGNGWGGGLACLFDSTYSMHDCYFGGNDAGQGGGLFVRQSEVTVFRTDFERNQAFDGGGVYVLNPYNTTPAELDIDSCGFYGNDAASNGGALHAIYYANVRVSKSDFFDNRAEDRGGAIHFGSKLELFVANARFGRNAAEWGGASSHDGDQYEGNPAEATYVNCTFTGNSAVSGGSALFNDLAATRLLSSSASLNAPRAVGTLFNTSNASCRVGNTIVWRNASGALSGPGFVVAYSDIEGGYAGAGNISVNPLFVDPAGADGVAGTPDDDLRLQSGSPCRDTGLNSALPADVTDLDGDSDTTEATPLDLDLAPRLVNGTVDMGAYEHP